MIKYFYFILLFLLVSCSSTGIKLVDEYYIYPPDDYYDSYYLKCKLSSDNATVIDSVHIVYWNDSTIIIERKAKLDNAATVGLNHVKKNDITENDIRKDQGLNPRGAY